MILSNGEVLEFDRPAVYMMLLDNRLGFYDKKGNLIKSVSAVKCRGFTLCEGQLRIDGKGETNEREPDPSQNYFMNNRLNY